MNIVEKNWEQILKKMKLEYCSSNISYNTWIAPLTVYEVTDDTVYILVKLKASLEHIEEKYMLPFKVCIAEVTEYEYNISFVTEDNIIIHKKKEEAAKKKKTSAVFESANLNPKYTFDTFVVGNNNNFAHAASLAVAESPGDTYNPLFIYGGVGLGKTHLMHSIAHHILANHPKLKIQYVPSEVFTNEVIDAIRNGSNSQINAIRDKYRNVDVLLIDDIQFIIGKDRTQEEFFNTFNVLYNAGKQIVVSSDKPPKEMTTLEERFRSRFQWGCMADIGSPDYETRMAILRRKEEMDNIKFDDEIIKYIATNIKSNIRELEGALNRLMAFSRLTNVEITIETAKEQLESIINPDLHREVTPQLIIEIVAEHFQKTPQQLISKSRSSDIVRPRQIAMYLCKNMTGASLAGIGEILGGRDHSTIIHGIEKIEAEYQSNESTQKLIETIRKKINPN